MSIDYTLMIFIGENARIVSYNDHIIRNQRLYSYTAIFSIIWLYTPQFLHTASLVCQDLQKNDYHGHTIAVHF